VASRSARTRRSSSSTSRQTGTKTVFDDPYVFDIGRDPNPHLSFGGGGPHFCLGAHLARLEVKLLFESIAERMPHVRPTGAPRRLQSNFINGIKELPVSFTG
jgi:cholest-4-en-3-one 26-monooxygenase